MTIRFTKMHGLGNDFIVIDGIRQQIDLSAGQIATLARRHTGIGFDQCLIVEKSRQAGIDFFYRIFNADGNEVGQCGNGARCLARFVHHYGLTPKRTFSVATMTTQMQLTLDGGDQVTVMFARPTLNPADIPLNVAGQTPQYRLPLADGSHYLIHAIHVGNPHGVSVVANIASMVIKDLGKELSEHPYFPEQANISFMECLSSSLIQLRVYERGCGETQACGSAAVAAAAIGRLFYQLDKEIQVKLLGGNVLVRWENPNEPIYLQGPATFVYEGVLFDE